MISFTCPIADGDYQAGGAASRGLKAVLVGLGVDAEAIRRVMIAAYEAEMNVVIHAHGGTLSAAIRDDDVIVEVVDDGPGIADLELAMRPGFSTAPARAREIGFGAGLGLPNIKRHVDDLRLESRAGRGTTLSFRVRFGGRDAHAAAPSPFVQGLGAAVVARSAAPACEADGAPRAHEAGRTERRTA